jgi:hypothetical protein
MKISLSPHMKMINNLLIWYKFGYYFTDFDMRTCSNKNVMYYKVVDLFELYGFHINFFICKIYDFITILCRKRKKWVCETRVPVSDPNIRGIYQVVHTSYPT